MTSETNNNNRIQLERNVENLVRNTLIGVFAPLGLVFITRNARLIKSSMLIGGGIGIGLGLNGFKKSSFSKECCKSKKTTTPVVEEASQSE